jgi:hypothetical protein
LRPHSALVVRLVVFVVEWGTAPGGWGVLGCIWLCPGMVLGSANRAAPDSGDATSAVVAQRPFASGRGANHCGGRHVRSGFLL